MKTISIATPCYNEEVNVRDCYEGVRRPGCAGYRERPEFRRHPVGQPEDRDGTGGHH